MSRPNISAILSRADKTRAVGHLIPASPKAKVRQCGLCPRKIYTASGICPDWGQHKFLYVPAVGGLPPVLGDSTDLRNYIGGWRGAGKRILKGGRSDTRVTTDKLGVPTSVTLRDRWTAPKTDRSVKRAKNTQAQQDERKADAKALAEREAAYQAIAWPAKVTDLQKEAYYWTWVKGLSLSKAGKKMKMTKRMVKRHADIAKKSI
jgi:hypothetical protein